MPGPTNHTETELRSLMASFSEVLQVSKDSIFSDQSTSNDFKVQDLKDETLKLVKLIYAHTTKIGIAFRPPVSIDAAYSQLKDISKYFVLLISIVSLYEHDRNFSKFFVSEVKAQIVKLITVYINFLRELNGLNFSEKQNIQAECVDGRLVNIGITWDICDALQRLINGGNLELLKKNIKESIALVEDVHKEFGEWIESPEKVDDSDPFGFNDKDEEEDEEEDDEEDDETLDPEALLLAKRWLGKVKLIKLLLGSLSKSLPSDESGINGKDLDVFNQEQYKLIEHVDDLVAGFFVWSSLYELESTSKKISKQSEHLIELVNELNKGDENKVKWLKIWLERFLDN